MDRGTGSVRQAIPIRPVDGSCPITSETESFLVSLTENDPDVRSVGWIGKIDGGAMPFGALNFSWGNLIRISTKREVDFHGLDLVTGMFFGQTGGARISLFLGPSYKRLNQESETFAYESNRAPEVNNLTLTEELEAWYWGGVIGTRFDLPFKERWNFTFDGRLGVYYLNAKYGGSQRTLLTSSDPDLDEPTAWSTSDSAVATTLNFQTALSVTCLERITFQLGTGVKYLSQPRRCAMRAWEKVSKAGSPTHRHASSIQARSACSPRSPLSSGCSGIVGFRFAHQTCPDLRALRL